MKLNFTEADVDDTDQTTQAAKLVVALVENRPPVLNCSFVFDIETGPLPTDEIRRVVGEFNESAVPHPGPFDPASVKVGNLKDETKIKEEIGAAREQHEARVASYQFDIELARGEYWRDVVDNAPLSPLTGRILAIGYGDGEQIVIDDSDDERDLLGNFWGNFSPLLKCMGWNIANFDVRFIAIRSAILGVSIPNAAFGGKWLSQSFVDLMDYWNFGSRMHYDPIAKKDKTGAKAKDVARLMGFGRPASMEVEGKDFHCFFNGSRAERDQAIEYLAWDIYEEVEIAKRFGLI